MSIIRDANQVRGIYMTAADKGWVLPCFCSENQTTTEAILSAAEDHRRRLGFAQMPIIVAQTCNYEHRNNAADYTHTRSWKTGLRLFTDDVKALAGEDGPYSKLQVMIHLDHIQPDADKELLDGDLSDFASIMFDASARPFEENIAATAEFVKQRRREIVIEGACDEIVDATGTVHNALTTPEKALLYCNETGADMIVANLGTEHRATGKELQYHGDVARQIRDQIGKRIVLHGLSSVPNDQVTGLFSDGIVKANIWTSLERDSSPALFAEMVRQAEKVAGEKTVRMLIEEGLLTDKALTGDKPALTHFTTMFRQDIVYAAMKKLVGDYLALWYR